MSEFEYTISDITSFLKHIAPKIAAAKVIIIGESGHKPANFKREMTKFIPEFRKRGFTHFGSEMIPANKTDMMTRFTKGQQGSAQQLKDHLEYSWQQGGIKGSDSYFDMYNAARIANMTIVGLDVTYDETNNKTRNYLNKHKLCGIGSKRCIDSHHEFRNVRMANEIQKYVQKGYKVLAYMHEAHASTQKGKVYNDPNAIETGVKHLLIEKGIPTLVIKFVGAPKMFITSDPSLELPAYKDIPETFTQTGGKTETFARKNNVRDKWFFIQKNPTPWSEDYILHLPQVGIQYSIKRIPDPRE